MSQRYVRVQATNGSIHYGLLQLSREVKVLDAPPWLKGHLTDLSLPADGYQLLAPCLPSKIVAVGKNYANHAAEMGTSMPSEPLLFLKPPTAVLAPQREILYPPQSQQVEYEGELALIIGQRCCNCSVAEAGDQIWGYTVANDVTARDLQRRDQQWTRAKGFDSFCPLGPWVVREISPSARLQTFINDDLQPVQSASIDQMAFGPEALVSYISQVMTLLPGDVILTGTPEGVGAVQPGDRIRVEIEGIGSLENPVVRRQ
ncbi:MAG: fumarylacetoacetate hydrolase family protein [Aphanocapsa sp. GSE-SYN-MK-11-07L]|jgi:2-keto-4-pentenoate hydratase/2-oxohepta-3-ene-1,7-dioic acid hydratase in catechol pathway|nr:fumarylacetoacetate hydrolase family protein [Aphanocapsa sp. GSE-SYN-MK-11-07L]